MDRRNFIKGVIGAVATVAIATKLAPKFPKYEYKTYGMGFTITRERMENELLTPEEIGQRMAEALAKSMQQTKENVAARVFWNDEADYLRVEGITAEEFYRG